MNLLTIQHQYFYQSNCMSQPKNTTNNRSFLDKFQGRTNKVGKLGVQAVLTNQQPINNVNGVASGRNKDRNKSNGDIAVDHQDQFRKVDLDALIPSNPQKNSIGMKALNSDNIVKRRQSLGKQTLKSAQKQDYIPSAYTPQTTSKQYTPGMNHPPSRSLSNSTGSSRGKYIFGKYLKLDKDALSHIDFLQAIQEKSFFKKH